MKGKTTQNYKAEYLDISQSYINQLFSGKKKMTWSLAEKLSKFFPEKNIEWWRHANPMHIELFLDANIPEPVSKRKGRNEP